MKFKTFRLLVIGGLLTTCGVIAGVTMNNREKHAQERTRVAHEAARTRSRAPATATPTATSVDAYLLKTLGQPASDEKLKDALGSGNPKINVYREGGTWVRAKVDRDRDEKWDEKWSIKDGVIQRETSTADNETYDRSDTWNGTSWGAPGAAPAAPVAAQAAPAAASPGGPRAVDNAVLSAIKRPVSKKVKDAVRGQAFKVNLYSDSGTRFDRAKVDLDRDDKWDEKWTFKADGAIERQVAPGDDENYTETWVLQDGQWARK